jgi:hypothetical protein
MASGVAALPAEGDGAVAPLERQPVRGVNGAAIRGRWIGSPPRRREDYEDKDWNDDGTSPPLWKGWPVSSNHPTVDGKAPE